MIITEQKPIEELIDALKGYSRVFLIGCGECATTCKTGGKDELARMQLELEKCSKIVVGSCIPNAPCVASQTKTEFAKNMKALRQAEAVLVFACGLGVQSVKTNDRFGLAVLSGCNTLFGAVMDAKGDFYEKCSLCAECVLNETNCICPVTLCAKGLLNGPCGGMNKGKCEVDKEKDCVWVLIYQEAQKSNKLKEFSRIKGPRNFKKSTKPHKLIMTGGK